MWSRVYVKTFLFLLQKVERVKDVMAREPRNAGSPPLDTAVFLIFTRKRSLLVMYCMKY